MTRGLAADHKRLVSNGYDRIADEYLQRCGASAVRAKWLSLVLALLEGKTARVLDLGCGAGIPVARALVAAGHQVVGVDGSARQISLARANVPNGEFLQADMSMADFAAGSFDAVTAFYSITHLPRAEHGPLLRRIAGWLTPGGALVATLGAHSLPNWQGEWLGTKMFFSHYDAATNLALLREAGFTIERAEEMSEDDEDARFLWVAARAPVAIPARPSDLQVRPGDRRIREMRLCDRGARARGCAGRWDLVRRRDDGHSGSGVVFSKEHRIGESVSVDGDLTTMPQDDVSTRAMQAAIAVARRLGADGVAATILHASEHVSIRLSPLDVVARVRVVDQPAVDQELRREVAVARHLVRKAAPVVGPSTALPAGPHFQDGLGITLWQFVEHVAADSENRTDMESAARALRRIHDALADFPGALPPFRTKIDKCRALLQDRSALTALPGADRAFLLAVHGRVTAALDAFPLEAVPIHGDAGAHNVFITAAEALYADFSDVSLGPREWDIGFLPDIDLTPFKPIDRDLLAVLGDLRGLCVAVWCWAKYEMPEKREAADYHLGYLKERFA